MRLLDLLWQLGSFLGLVVQNNRVLLQGDCVRFHPHTPQDIQTMLQTLGLSDVKQLFASIPESLQLHRPLNIPRALSEDELVSYFKTLSKRPDLVSFLGAGLNPHLLPEVADSIIRRSEFYTSYTPYQPEMSQGTLQAIFEFQTMISELFGLPVANASMYDGASAFAESLLMALRIHPERRQVLISNALHPEYQRVGRTFLSCQDATISTLPVSGDGSVDRDTLRAHLSQDVAVVAIQNPNFFGHLEDIFAIAQDVHAVGALLVVVVNETLALGVLESPGTLGADIVVGEGLNMLGGPMFGGPALGLFACQDTYLRQMPGRLCGEATDKDGQKGYVLTLSTREQHIRRDKATSNICTNQGLIALAYAVHLALRGPQGLRELAIFNMSVAHELEQRLAQRGISRVFSGPYFNEFVVYVEHAKIKHQRAYEQGIVAGLLLEDNDPNMRNMLLLAVNESHEESHVQQLVEVLAS